jgi:hypothetical protein
MGLTSLFMDGGVQRGTHASFDQLVEIVDAVGDRIDVSWRPSLSAPRRSASAAIISILWLRQAKLASSGRSAWCKLK